MSNSAFGKMKLELVQLLNRLDSGRPLALSRQWDLILVIVSILFVAVFGAAVFLYSTTYGIVIGWDSLAYLGGAREILEHSRYSSTHFPPLTSLLVALTSLASSDMLEGVRWVYLALFVLSIILFCITLYLRVPSPGFVLLGGLVFTIWLIGSFNILLSEPPFFVLTLISFLTLALHFRTESYVLLVISGVAAALSMATRYSGIVVIASNFIVLMWHSWRTRRKVLTLGAVYAGAVLIVIAPWLIWNRLNSGQITSRHLDFHAISVEDLGAMAENILEWILPERITAFLPPVLHILLAIGILILFAVVYFRFRDKLSSNLEKPDYLVELYGIFGLITIFFLIVSRLLFDPDIDLGYRQLSPVFMAFLYVCLGLVYESSVWQQNSHRLSVRPAAIGISVIIVIMYILPVMPPLQRMHIEGYGYGSKEWRTSELIAYLKTLPDDTTVYTNAPHLVSFYLERSVFTIPSMVNELNKSYIKNEDFLDQISTMEKMLEENDSVVVCFDNYSGNSVSMSELQERISMPEPEVFSDGVVYEFSK